MARTLNIASRNASVNQGTTHYYSLGGTASGTEATTAADQAPIYRAAGVISYLTAYVSVNTLSGNLDITVWKNGGAGSGTFTYTTGQTGLKEDTTNTDTVSAGDTFAYRVVAAAGTGAYTSTFYGSHFAATTNTVRVGGGSRGTGRAFSTASTVNPVGIVDGLNTGSTEANLQHEVRAPFTLNNAYIYVISNARTTDTTYRSRIGGAYGNLLVTYTSGQTGAKEDTSNSDSVVAGNLVNMAITTDTGTGNFIASVAFVNQVSTANQYSTFISGGFGQAATVARYSPLYGVVINFATEAPTQTTVRDNVTFSYLSTFSSSNANTGNSTIVFRKNGASGNQSITYASGQTGWKYDTTNKDTCVPGDLVCSLVTAGATGGNLIINNIGYLVTAGISFDASSNSGYQAASSSYSWNHTCSNQDRYLKVGIAMLSLAQTVSSITYNGVAMVFLGAQSSVTGAARVEMWGLVAPATGTNTIAVTLTGSIASAGVAASYNGVHQTSPVEGFNSAFATNVGAADATVNITTVAPDDWVVDVVATDDGAITVGAGQTERNNVTGVGGSGADSDEGPKVTPGAVTMSWTNVGAAATWAIAGVALRPVAASSLVVNTQTIQLFQLLGVGQ